MKNDFTFLPGASLKREQKLDVLSENPGGLAISILESSPDCIKLIELDGSLSYMNGNGMCAMEIDAFCAVEGHAWPSLWPKDAQTLLQSALEDAALGTASEFEAFCPTAKNAPRWWAVHVTPVRDQNGVVARILATSRDITHQTLQENKLNERDLQLQGYAEQLTEELAEKERLLEQQKILAGEIDHRVKNSFALIGSVLRLQMRGMEDDKAKDALSDAAARIGTLSRVHEQLYTGPDARSVSLKPYLTNLLSDLGATLTDRSVIDAAQMADVEVASDTATGLGLVTAELVTNALKHRVDHRPVTVTVSLREIAEEGALELVIEDDADGLPEDFDMKKSKGLGMQICRIYGQQLKGQFICGESAQGGARFALTFPNG